MASFVFEKTVDGMDVRVSVPIAEMGDGSAAAILETAYRALREQQVKETMAVTADVQIAELQAVKTEVVAVPK
jgi:hypothetical protein